jgi:PDZ domain
MSIIRVNVFRRFALYSVILPITTLGLPVEAFALTSDTAYCATTRDSYVASSKKRFESQSYEGKGNAGAGIGKTGISVGGGGEYNWDREWDNFDSSQKREYEQKNCDELLRQKGLVTVAEIRANSELAIARLQEETKRYVSDNSEATKRYVSDNNLEGTKNTNSAGTTQTGIVEGVRLFRTIIGSGDNRDTNKTTLEVEKIRAETALKMKEMELRQQQAANNITQAPGVIGVQLKIIGDKLLVASVFNGTPAAEAGVLSNDVVTHIDNFDTQSITLQQAMKLIRGMSGTPVNLKILRNGEYLTFNIKRVPMLKN